MVAKAWQSYIRPSLLGADKLTVADSIASVAPFDAIACLTVIVRAAPTIFVAVGRPSDVAASALRPSTVAAISPLAVGTIFQSPLAAKRLDTVCVSSLNFLPRIL